MRTESAPTFPAAGTVDGARRVRVAAAADLKFALEEVVAAFERSTPTIHVETTVGSSGNFYSQLSNKAPFDVFLSADSQYPDKLVKTGLADGATEFHYAVGQIVLWVPKASTLDLERLQMNALLEPSVRKVAVANPRHAPYGRAAEAALQSLGLLDRLKGKLVYGENVAQTAQFVETGAADAGIIADSLALSPPMKGKGRFWTVPATAYPKLDQVGVVLNWARDHEAAVTFCRFLQDPSGQKILARYGFAAPRN